MTELWLDGSRYQGSPDFGRLRAGGLIGVVWNIDDPAFLQRIAAALAVGLEVASYHFTQTGQGSPQDAALHHLRQIASLGQHLTFVAGDHESGTGDLTDWTHAYQQSLTIGHGRTAWFYSGAWWIAQHIRRDAVQLREWPLWDAKYGGSFPAPPAPWTSVAMWQFTSTAYLPGVAGPVDEDLLVGHAFRTPSSYPAPTPLPEDPDMTPQLAAALAALGVARRPNIVPPGIGDGTIPQMSQHDFDALVAGIQANTTADNAYSVTNGQLEAAFAAGGWKR